MPTSDENSKTYHSSVTPNCITNRSHSSVCDGVPSSLDDKSSLKGANPWMFPNNWEFHLVFHYLIMLFQVTMRGFGRNCFLISRIANYILWLIFPTVYFIFKQKIQSWNFFHQISYIIFTLRLGWCLLAPGPASSSLPEPHSSHKPPKLHCMLRSLCWHLRCWQWLAGDCANVPIWWLDAHPSLKYSVPQHNIQMTPIIRMHVAGFQVYINRRNRK
jgi:hypothetical protein